MAPAEAAFERGRRVAGVLLAPAAFAAAWLTTGGLGPQGQPLSAILATVVVLWICETLPLPVTALLGAILCVLLGVGPARQVFACFADPIHHERAFGASDHGVPVWILVGLAAGVFVSGVRDLAASRRTLLA